MSVMNCTRCDQLVDTDFDLGSWEYEEIPEETFYCAGCVDDVLEEIGRKNLAKPLGKPVADKYFDGKGFEDTDLEFYIEEIDDHLELPVKYQAKYYPAEYGSREAGTGLQLEPDYPAGTEVEDFHVEIDGLWYYFDPTENQIEAAEKNARDD